MKSSSVAMSCLLGVVILSVYGLSIEPARAGMEERDRKVAPEEDASALGILPNGIVTIPDHDTENVSMFSFRNNQLRKSPLADLDAGESSRTVTILEALRKNSRGDILYDDAEGGTIIVCSGNIMNLGQGLLCELRSKVSPQFEMTQLVRVVVGSRYMIRTVNRRYAVFRVLEETQTGLRIQWIYQPADSTVFVIPSRLEPDDVLHDVLFSCVSMRSAVDGLRRKGLRVCLERARGEKVLETTKKVAWPKVRVRVLLDDLTDVFPEYQWRIIANSNIVLVFSRAKTPLDAKPFFDGRESLVIAKASWIDVIRLLKLDTHGIQFPAETRRKAGPDVAFGSVYKVPDDKTVSLEIDHRSTLREILGVMCKAYDDGMYYETDPPKSKSPLELYFRLP